MITKIKRPIIRYHGGKWLLAPWILSHFPEHKVYVESFGGGGSILLRKQRSYSEVYNDLDSDIVNLFRVVRDNGNELREMLVLTPFSRDEFKLSYQYTENPIERARRTMIRAFMGFGSAAATSGSFGGTGFRSKGNGVNGSPTTGFRSSSNRSGTTPAHDWANYPKFLNEIINRLRGVVIENREASEIMIQHDSVNTLHYVDPPYINATRYSKGKVKAYNFEMSDEEHIKLCGFLRSLKGCVIVSGYDNAIYNEMLDGWYKTSKDAFADGAKKRVEVLWSNRPLGVQMKIGL